MTRRISRVILLVTTVALLAFGLPLALMIRRIELDRRVARLETEATRVALDVPASLEDADSLESIDAEGRYIGVYDAVGHRRLGLGPAAGDAPVRTALEGAPAHTVAAGRLVVAIPIISDQEVRSVVRIDAATAPADASVRGTWLLMSGLALGVFAAAAVAAHLEAKRLSRPVEDLSTALEHLGQGDFGARTAVSGVPELDTAARSMNATAKRLGEMLERERAFATQASHQLRTPLTGIRIQLENALRHPEGANQEQLAEALGAAERLETTISDLLELAHESREPVDQVDLDALIVDQAPAWQVLASTTGRALVVDVDPTLGPIPGSEAAVRQILEVLVSNAFLHGAGTVTVSAKPRVGGVAVEVSDEGPGVSVAPAELFDSHADGSPGDADGHGLGLPLAHALAEATGGRLVVREPAERPCFALLLVVADD